MIFGIAAEQLEAVAGIGALEDVDAERAAVILDAFEGLPIARLKFVPA